MIVPPRNPAALAEAIAGMVSDPARMLAMGVAGNARVTERFTLERMSGTIVEQVYQPLLASCGNRFS